MAAMALGGCASVRQSIGGWFGETPPPEATAAAARQGQTSAVESLTYYAAVEGLTVYAEASESSKVVGHLALYEKVVRSRLERGYAYVSAAKGGLTGWVDNAKLVWRVPASTATEAADRAEPSATSGAPAAEPTPTSTPETQAPPTLAPTPPPTRTVAAPQQYEPF